jgi:hypothetical protein
LGAGDLDLDLDLDLMLRCEMLLCVVKNMAAGEQ